MALIHQPNIKISNLDFSAATLYFLFIWPTSNPHTNAKQLQFSISNTDTLQIYALLIKQTETSPRYILLLYTQIKFVFYLFTNVGQC